MADPVDSSNAADPTTTTAVAGIRQGVHDLLYNHPILGSVLRLAETVKPTTAAAPAAAPAADLTLDLPPVKDIALPMAKPIELPAGPDKPIAAPKGLSDQEKSMAKRPLYSDAEVSPGLRANRDYYRKRSGLGRSSPLSGGKR